MHRSSKVFRTAARQPGHVAGKIPNVCLLMGLLVLVAMFSPWVDSLTDRSLAIHMTEHMAIMLIAVPLLVLARPGRFLKLRLPALHFGSILVGFLFAAGLWLWHIPVLFDAAQESIPVHVLQHVTFFAVAWLFWCQVLDKHETEPARAGLVFTTMLHTSVLGVLMTFAVSPWYARSGAPLWHLSDIDDQHLAGVLMWVPMNLLLTVVLVALLYGWLRRAELASAA